MEHEPDEIRSDVAVPEVIRAGLDKRMLSCHRVVVDYETAENKFRKVAAWKLGGTPGDYPDDDVDEVAQQVIDAINSHWLEQGGDEPQNYKIWCHTLNKDAKRRRLPFTYLYAGPEEADAMDAPFEDDRDERAHEENQVLAAALRILDKVALRLDDAHVHIKEISNQNHAIHQPLIDAMQHMGGAYVAGLEMQKQAMGVMFDVRRGEREDAAAERRIEKWGTMLGPALQVGMGQFMQFVAAKAGIQVDLGPVPSSTRQSAPSTTGNGEPAEHNEAVHTLASVCAAFGDGLTGAQWGAAVQAFSRKELALLTALFNCETDEKVLEVWEVVEGGIDQGALMGFVGALDPEQIQTFMLVKQTIDQARATPAS